jgi:hypothetical protein
MKESQRTPHQHKRSYLLIGGALGLLTLSSGAWAANDLAVAAKTLEAGINIVDSYNMELLGWNDMQGRVIYQTSVHTFNTGTLPTATRVIAVGGSFSGTMLNPMTGVVEQNGAGLVDSTDPTNPVYLKHLPANNGGSRMVKFCDGNVLPKGIKNHVYLLRENGALSHEIYDVTIPENPQFVTTIITGQNTTHRNYWDCRSGLGYLVAGASAKAANPDGWLVGQHVKVYDLSDPANPKFVVEFGLPGQNPGTNVPVAPAMVHGPIVVSTMVSQGTVYTKNRLYMPYGVGSDGVIQIVDLTKMLPPPYGSGKYTDPHKPTDLELLQGEIGRVSMPGAEGGHTSWPMYNISPPNIANFTENTTRDILGVTSEETDNRCTGSPHYMYLLDITANTSGGGSSTAEQHPWPISTVTVDDQSGRPNYCSRGTRFGVHSTHEEFDNPLYRKLVTSAWFDAGIRVNDVRDPYHPTEVAHLVYPINSFTQPSNSTINGITYSQLDVSCDNTEVDDDGLIYCSDRVGSGMYITKLTGAAAAIIGGGKTLRAKATRRTPITF